MSGRFPGAICALLMLGAAGPVQADEAPCSVRSVLEPERAVVGQQVSWRAIITRRSDVRVEWEEAPRFPGLRAEWLPGRGEARQHRAGEAIYFQREEHRALFAPRSGRFSIPGATLRCETEATRTTPARSEAVGIAAGELIVDELPEAKAPPDFRGLVGPLTVRTHIDRNRIELGRSVRVSVMMLGAANLWDAGPPLPELEEMPGVEVFRETPLLDQQTGDKLYVRRVFRIDIVPRDTGRLLLPETRVPYYHPEKRSFEVASAAALTIEVVPRGEAPGRDPGAQASSSGRGKPDESIDARRPWIWWGAALALAFAAAQLVRVGLAGGWRRSSTEVDTNLAAARAASDPRAGAAAYERALRAALAVKAPELTSLEAGRLRAEAVKSGHGELLGAIEVLADLQRSRYAAEVEALDVAGVEAAIAKLQSPRTRGGGS